MLAGTVSSSITTYVGISGTRTGTDIGTIDAVVATTPKKSESEMRTVLTSSSWLINLVVTAIIEF